jgi:PAS domain S-box-containing protein
MNIKHILIIVITGIVLFSAIFSVSIYALINEYESDIAKHAVVDQITTVIFESRLLGDDYIFNPGERAKIQWYAKQSSIKKLITSSEAEFKTVDEKALLASIQDKLKASEAIFVDMTSLVTTSATPSALLSARKTRLAGELSVKAQETISDMTKLTEIENIAATSALHNVILLLSVAASSFLIMLLISFGVIFNNAKKIQDNNKRFDFVSKAINDAIYDWNIATNSVWFSEGIQKIFGYRKDQVKETLTWWSENIHPDDKKRIDDEIEKILKSSDEKIFLEYRYKRADGTYADVTDNAYLVRDSSKKPIRYVGVMQDITKEKELTQSLKEKTASMILEASKSEAMLKNIGDGLIVIDEYGKISKVNQSALTMLGFSEDELLHQWMFKNVQALDEKESPIAPQERPATEALSTGKIVVRRLLYLTKDGTKLPVSVTVSPIILNNKPVGAIEVFRDISREKELEKLKDEFVSLASHELRTPMTAIKGFVSMIREGDFGPVSKELEEPIADIGASTDRLIHLVNDMLNVSRIEAGRLTITLTDEHIKSIVEEVVATLLPIVKQKNITLEAKEIEDTMVEVDVDKVKQVLNNIIGNSLKFTDTGGITITTKTEAELLKVFITDTGMGITKEDQTKLFGKFKQISSQQKGKPVGTGLGLYLSRELIRKMGGDMWIETSELGKGSTFAFSLPVSNSQLAKTVQMAIKKEAEAHPDQKS